MTQILDDGLEYDVTPGTRPIAMHDFGEDHFARSFGALGRLGTNEVHRRELELRAIQNLKTSNCARS